MKVKFLLISLIISLSSYSQVIGDKTSGMETFNQALKSGFYHTWLPQEGYPAIEWNADYKYLINVRNSASGTAADLHQWQISTSYSNDDRVFFRKTYPYNAHNYNQWHEFATRGTNTFTGKQRINGLLEVAGNVRTKELVVETIGADFVFEPDYQLKSLSEVKAHIEENKHLPDIPSAAQMQENGVGISELSTKLLQKVEELTLYAIQQNEMIEELNKRIEELEESKK